MQKEQLSQGVLLQILQMFGRYGEEQEPCIVALVQALACTQRDCAFAHSVDYGQVWATSVDGLIFPCAVQLPPAQLR